MSCSPQLRHVTPNMAKYPHDNDAVDHGKVPTESHYGLPQAPQIGNLMLLFHQELDKNGGKNMFFLDEILWRVEITVTTKREELF